MNVHASSREAIVSLAAEWCRQTAVVEPDRLSQLLTDDSVIHGLATDGGILRGYQEVLSLCERLAAIYPQRECRMVSAVVEGDNVACRWVMTVGSRSTTWRTDAGQIEGMTFFIVRDNRIVELWTNFGRWWV